MSPEKPPLREQEKAARALRSVAPPPFSLAWTDPSTWALKYLFKSNSVLAAPGREKIILVASVS